MKSWTDLIADVDKLVPYHFTPGRPGPIRRIVLHHNAGNLSIEGCYNTWLVREASAHYQVEQGGRIGQLVNDGDQAWHAGNWNADSIGIEHANNGFGDNAGNGWTISEATLDNGAHLVAALCRKYGLGRPEWGRNVFGHRDVMMTACPGEIAMRQRDDYMLRAQFYYDNLEAGGSPAREQDPVEDNMQITRPDKLVTTSETVLAYADVRLEKLEWQVAEIHSVLGKIASAVLDRGLPVFDAQGMDTGDRTDLATEAAWNRQNFVASLSAAGLSQEQVQQIADTVAKSVVKVDISVAGQDA